MSSKDKVFGEFVREGRTMTREPTADERAGMTWWNDQAETERAHWLRVAGSAKPADAWAAFKAAHPNRTP